MTHGLRRRRTRRWCLEAMTPRNGWPETSKRATHSLRRLVKAVRRLERDGEPPPSLHGHEALTSGRNHKPARARPAGASRPSVRWS
jgi:hypothetical protein